MDKQSVIIFLQSYGVDALDHSRRSLLTHLTGTHDFLEAWGYAPEVCIAGLCHSIYGTESYRKTPIELIEREIVRAAIGERAERLTYYFGALKKDSFWKNLGRTSGITITDRFSDTEIELSPEDFSGLVALTLANWLEQRPQAGPEHHLLRKDEFTASKPYLNEAAYTAFCKAYGISQ